MNTSLSLIAAEAQRLVGRMHESQRRGRQNELANHCEQHWQSLRGPEPSQKVARTLWEITPALADLFVDLYTKNEAGINAVLPDMKLSTGLALLTLLEIERGNETGVHVAHEPMLAFESAAPPTAWLERIAALLRGTLEPLRYHDKHGALWRSLVEIATHTCRIDLPAILAIIRLLAVSTDAANNQQDDSLAILLHQVNLAGIRFLAIADDHIHYEQHHKKKKPIRTRQVGEILLDIRHQWIG
jgi:hypothetical protein